MTWTVVEIWGRQGVNFIVFVVLARLLSPADVGLVALATVFVALAQLVVDQGLGDALIQRRGLTKSEIDTAFWAAMATGLGLTLVFLVAAAPVASALKAPGLEPILQVLSLSFVLAGFSTIQIDLLRRDLSFGRLAARTLAATGAGGVVGILMAFAGFGAWSLVGQQLASAAFSVLTLWRVSPWRPSRHFSWTEFRTLFSFGVRVLGSDVLNFVSRNADNLLIGAVLGPTLLGFYAVGYRILDVTQTVLINVARKIAFPVLSRLQEDRGRMVAAYLTITRLGSLVILPGYVALVILAQELIVVLFGSKWGPSAPVAATLFLIGPVLTIQAFSNSMLNAVGQPGVVLNFRLISTVVNVVGFVIAVRFGIVAVAAVFVVRGYLLTPLILFWMRGYAAVPVGAFLLQFRSTALATALMAVSMFGVRLAASGFHPVSRLLLTAAVGFAVLAVTLWVVDRGLVSEARRFVREAIPGIGRFTSRGERQIEKSVSGQEKA